MIFNNYKFQKKDGVIPSIYNYKVKDLNNQIVDLNTKKNKVILVINSASS